jgi:hypothetical protein
VGVIFCKEDSQAGKGEVGYEQHICEKSRGEKMEKNEQEKSQEMFDEVITRMKEWRASHPKATMREIELEARSQRSDPRVHTAENHKQTREMSVMTCF